MIASRFPAVVVTGLIGLGACGSAPLGQHSDHDGGDLHDASTLIDLKRLLPVYVYEPRSSTNTSWWLTITGTLRVPSSTVDFQGFDGAVIEGHGWPAVPLTVGSSRLEGDEHVADFTVDVATHATEPAREREILTVRLASLRINLTTVLDDQNHAEFSSGSAALQALVLARVPFGSVTEREFILTRGLRDSDAHELAGRAGPVKAAIEATLAAGEGTGLDKHGFPLAGGRVAEAIDVILASPAVPRPEFVGAVTQQRLTRLGNLVPGAWFTIFPDDGWPTVTLANLQPDATGATVLFQNFDPVAGKVATLRQAVVDATGAAGRSAGSAVVTIEHAPAQLPASPVFTHTANALEVSQVTAGNWVLFVGGYGGFELVEVPEGSSTVTLPKSVLPRDRYYYYALQVTADPAVSLPSQFLFPSDIF